MSASLAGKGGLPEAPTDSLAQPKKPLGPVGKIGKRGFKSSRFSRAMKYSKRGM